MVHLRKYDCEVFQSTFEITRALFPKKQFSKTGVNFSDFSKFLKTFSDYDSQKMDQRVTHEPVFVTPDGRFKSSILSSL